MVATAARHNGVARELIRAATGETREAGCEWLDVDFEAHLRTFYFDAYGFTPTYAGLKRL